MQDKEGNATSGDESNFQRGRKIIEEFAGGIGDPTKSVSGLAGAMIGQRMEQIDHLVSRQLVEVMGHPAFQKLEGTWRGLKSLVDRSDRREQLKIKVMSSTKEELFGGMEKPAEVLEAGLVMIL